MLLRAMKQIRNELWGHHQILKHDILTTVVFVSRSVCVCVTLYAIESPYSTCKICTQQVSQRSLLLKVSERTALTISMSADLMEMLPSAFKFFWERAWTSRPADARRKLLLITFKFWRLHLWEAEAIKHRSECERYCCDPVWQIIMKHLPNYYSVRQAIMNESLALSVTCKSNRPMALKEFFRCWRQGCRCWRQGPMALEPKWVIDAGKPFLILVKVAATA